MTRRISLLARMLALLAVALATPAVASDQKFVATDDLTLVYFDPSGTHLVPYALQCYLGALAAQRKLLGYQPEAESR